MRRIVFPALIWTTTAAVAAAAPGVTTTNVNLRSGPGTNHSVIRSLPAGTALDIGDCDSGGSWCAVKLADQDGFVSGSYLEQTQDPTAWPRSYEVGTGRMILYQPQFTAWTDFKKIEALVAAEYLKTADAKPVFGVIGLKGDTVYDQDADEIVITNVSISQLDFSSLGRDDLSTLQIETGKLLPTGPITVSEARVTASLADQTRTVDVANLKSDPPKIFVSNAPARLLQTDGAPVYAPVKGKTGLSFVVNTNWDLFRVDDGGKLFLRDDTHWLTANAIDGPWSTVTSLPSILSALPNDEAWNDARAAMPPEPYPQGKAPRIIATSQTSELIEFDGEPALEDVRGTALQWASNTETDLFFDKAGKQWYVLLSGRWFRAPDLNGPWVFTTTQLPDDFQNIPEDAPYYSVRSSVPGTSESAEARLRASIPTTARVEKGSITPAVSFAGTPQFSPVEGTDVAYATNTTDTVIQVGSRYFLLQDGVWFVSDHPDGPWELASEVPDEIYQIPASSPLYNVTYVRIYDTEPDAVWYGYSMGYLFGFLAWGTYVYGTGWHYPPYWYNGPGYGYPIYYPRPVTWGVGAYYNPVRGVYGRYGYAYGPYRGIGAARAWNPRTGTYARAGAAWGPNGSAGFVAAYNPRTDRGGYAAGGRNVYGAWKSAGVKNGSDWARAAARTNAAGGSSVRWNTSAGQGFVREGRRGDVYAGRDGNIYRNTGNGWQTFDGGWQNVARPKQDQLLKGDQGLRSMSPEARDKLQQRGGGEALAGLAGAGAAGAAAGALGQGIARGQTGARPNRDATRAEIQQRAAGREGGELKRQAPSRSGSAERRATAPKATQRPKAKPIQPAASRQMPTNLQRDSQARYRGNQRQMASQQHSRSGGRNISGGGGSSRSFSGGGRGGGGFSGGGGGRGGGGRGGGGRR